MTNTVPGIFYSAAAPMSSRSSMITPRRSSSYAAVVAGQTRLPHISTENSGIEYASPYLGQQYRNSGFGRNELHEMTTPATVPSYLANSLYAERLAARNSNALKPVSMSPKSPRSHGGLVLDVIEHAFEGEDRLQPLPSRWNESDKQTSLELLNGGTEARFCGPPKVSDTDAAAVRADKPMPPQCGLFYYEVAIMSKGKEGSIAIGFCGEKVNLSKLPGWEQESWGYHGDDGNSFCHGPRKKYGPKFTTHDIIGCGVNFRTHSAFFTKNGVDLGIAFRDIPASGKLYPVIGMRKMGEHIKVNFGQEEFVFDIDDHMKNEKMRTYAEINRHPTTSLCPPLDETALIQALVAQYLAHDGYVDTASAFAEDVQKEALALDGQGTSSAIALDARSDGDAVNRQRIRSAILEGDVDRALKLTNAFYPQVLQDNEFLNFKLRRRKLVEMIRENAERINSTQNGHSHHHPNHYMQEMDLDDATNGYDRMDVEDEAAANSCSALNVAVEYAQDLGRQFDADNRPNYKDLLQEAFALIAYPDPKTSILSHLLDDEERAADAEELNSAILVSLGKSSVAALERMVKQSSLLVQDLSEEGGPAAFINVRNDYLSGFN